ncbi:alpha/beta fold hydrolase [Kribbella sp. NPDC058245]|uniref:alpha/beta fold hydrolase n=1 Tax=Kribbella sp. NPDC058245 TaxID=3346399 RepID=UPI0036E39B8A
MPTVDLPHGRFHYEDAGGRGLPVLALHGTFGRGRTFAALAERLLPDYRMIAPDLRGHGLTTAGGDFNREAFVADAAQFVETLGLAPVLLYGHSLGGVTAYQLAARRPELVQAVVVEDVGAVTDETAVPEPVLDVTGWPRRFATPAEAAEFFATTPAQEYFLESVVDGELLFDLDTMMQVQDGCRGVWWTDWEAVGCPLLLLRASNSFLLGPELATEMVRRLRGAELVVLDDTGHWMHRKDPDGCGAAVRAFFGRTTSRRPGG